MDFSEKIKRCRIMSGYTSKEMAELIKINPSTYSRYENGKSKPNIDTLKRIVNVLDIDANYLLKDDDSELVIVLE